MEIVTLRGAAVEGFEPHDDVRRLLSTGELKRTVMLGRIRPKTRPQVPRLRAFLDLNQASPPPTLNYREKAAGSIARMYLNDRYGCCVISGKAHALGVWSANDADSGGLVLATDDEIYSQYQGICGRGDNGCMIDQVLNVMKSAGFKAGGKNYKIDGYVEGDWTNKLEVQVAQYLFGATTIGINLPDAWTRDAVWDVTNTQIVGGHDVTPIDYDDRGVYIASWGRIYLITWAAFTSRKWLEEYYVLLAPLWYGNNKMAPNGVDTAKLQEALAQLGGGVIPNVDPTPTPPPVVCPAGQHWDAALAKCVPDSPGPGPGPVPVPAIGNFGLSLQASNWRTANGLPIADLVGTVRVNTKASSVEEALAEVNEAFDRLAAFIRDNPDAELRGPAGKVDPMTIFMDIMMLFMAYQSKNVYAMINAAIKLLTDLGVKVPPLPLPPL